MSSVVPEGWITSRIQEVVLKVIDNRGKTPPLSDSGYNLIEVACVRDDKQFLDYEKITKCVSEDTYQTWFRNGHPKVGDTIVPTVGSIGEFAFVRENRGCIAQNLVALRPSAVIEPLFLYFQCYSEVVQNNISRILMGAVQPSLRVPHFLETSLLLPPLPEQKKIASILTSVDEVIENTQKQIDKLQDLKKATMNELLTKGIGHTEFKDSELGQIPKSWEVVRFQEVFESYTYGPRFSSKDYSPIGNVKTIRGTDLTKDWCINYKQVPLAELDEKVVLQHRLKENDVVMITTADCGFSAVFKEQSIPFIASAYAIRLRPTLRINSSFCVCYLQTSIAKNQIEKYERKGTVSNLPGSDVMNVRVPLPSLDEQSEIVSALTSIDTNISNNLEKLHQTQSLKKSLMQDLLTGKVRVTVN